MKILIIGPLPDPVNGVSFANQSLLQNIRRLGLEELVIDTSTKTLTSKQGGSFSFKKTLAFLHTYLQIHKIFSADIIYTTPGQTFFGILKYAPFYLAALLASKPYILHVHGNYLGTHFRSLTGLKKVVFKYFVSNSAAGIVLSPSLIKNFEGLLPQDKIHVVENFVTPDLYDGLISPKPTDKLRIIYLSNLMEEKGILDVLDALILLKRQSIDFFATLAGAIEQGLEPKVKEKLAALGSQIEYLKTIGGKDKKHKLQEANVFILPTYYIMEGQPISILEGLATGNIIVTTRHAGIPDVVTEENGFFVEKRSASSLADCLLKINNNLQDQISKFATHNRAYASQMFTEEKFIGKILSICRTLVKAK